MQKLLNIIGEIVRKLGYDVYRVNKKSYSTVGYENFPKESLEKKRFYNIGAGLFRHPYWTNIDHKSDWYAEVEGENYIDFDLFSMQKLNIESDIAEAVYSSHTVEHINDAAAVNMFNEVYRILKRGCTFRFTTPNIDLYYKACKAKDYHFFYWIDYYSEPKEYKRVQARKPFNKASIQELFIYEFASHVSSLIEDCSLKKITDDELDHIFKNMNYEDALNHCTARCSLELQRKYPGYHINWWNINKATEMLQKAGFSEIYLSGYGQSLLSILRDTDLFDNTHPKVSMYIEAIK